MIRVVSRFILYGFLSCMLFSCNYFNQNKSVDAVARVGESYIYKEDIRSLLPDNYTKEDSLRIVNTYLDNWATKELLMLNAKRNISSEKIKEFNKLVEDYEKDLYGRYYKEQILNKSIDTTISPDEQVYFYNKNKEVFKLNEDLIKLRYILLPENANIKEIEKKFKRFDSNDKRELDSLHIHFLSSYLNDSTWVRMGNVYEKLPLLKDKKIKLGDYFNYEDTTGVYLIKINDYLLRTEQAPIEYVTPILKQIILNQRKLENAKKFEKQLIQSAIKKKQYEIYE